MDWGAGKGAGCCKPVTLEAGIDGLSSGAKSGLKSRHSAAPFYGKAGELREWQIAAHVPNGVPNAIKILNS